MKVSNLYIAQVKAKYGIIERENYNKANPWNRMAASDNVNYCLAVRK